MTSRFAFTRRAAIALGGALMLAGGPALAQETVKIGLILPMTGPFASTGRQIEAAAKLYIAEKGATVAGKKVELIVKDDTGTPDVTRRIAQELLVNDKVSFLAGFGLTPLAFAVAPLATQSKTPMIVMAAATSSITEQSPFIVRTSFTLPQVTIGIADWAAKNGVKKAMTLVSDYGPGIDAEKAFKDRLTAAGGEVTGEVRIPLRNPDFAPFLQRVSDAKPDALFVFVPSGVGSQFMKQFVERGLDKSGVRLIATGDVTDDDIVDSMGDVALGTITTHHYSANHNSPENKAFVAAFTKAANVRPNFMAVGGWDGMHLIYEALKKTNGATDGTALVEAMKGMSWTSPRGPISIDAKTRDIVQNVYVRKIEKVDGQLYNVEFSTFEAVPDPVKAGK
ncbi:ABC transporter substrate-binding protein [Bosea caraganae]|uniref:ABC transporter substrate-binding protein n=1 Tax=Bosea caraganae TaxID=2763117 RepID=A0A370L1S5_9HYPH|nr:ABC transporter substrate-binding protein [Bosea caraganae]RDJ21453.1 ABC transporter substrate-binding protein [Bosea caraganae]RDJ23421.1 ABC transporter substrate-binding protein [Bosea caraganae]